MAAVFPMMVDAHFVAHRMMMLVGLGGSDRAKGNYGCSEGKNDFLHYKVLNRRDGAYVTARRVPQRRARMPQIARGAQERSPNAWVNSKRRAWRRFIPAWRRDVAGNFNTRRRQRFATGLRAMPRNRYPFKTITRARA
jgi:hypothetical protein